MVKELPKPKIKGIEIAKHSLIGFDEINLERKYDHRYIVCKVISETFKSSNHGSISFLVEDVGTESKKIFRVSVYEAPSSWGTFCF